MPVPQTAPRAVSAAGPLDWTGLRRTVWQTRPDLRQLFRGPDDDFDCWLLINGRREYAAVAQIAVQTLPLLTEPAPEAMPGLEPVPTRLILAIWRSRPDLQTVFDITGEEGQRALVWWYFLNAIGEMDLHALVTPAQRAQLDAPDPAFTLAGAPPVTHLMAEIWRRRADVQAAFPLDGPAGRAAFLSWFFVHGVAEHGLARLIGPDQVRWLLSDASGDTGIPRILVMVWPQMRTLADRFRGPSDPAFAAWARGEGRRLHPVLDLVFGDAGGDRPARPGPRQMPPWGVNLLGYAKGQFGIGEDVRMAALACRAAGIPFSIYNLQPGREVTQDETAADGLIGTGLPHAVNILCTTGIETARLAAVHGRTLFQDRHIIGYWPWELPEWPADWQHAYGLVDEVWASSRYSFTAFAGSSPQPVRHAPMAVDVTPGDGLGRAALGLPEHRFLFAFSFDMLSSLERKNPLACIHAFRRAFPKGSEPAGLVIKVMRAVAGDPAWEAIRAEILADPRILVIDRTLSRGGILDLYRSTDVFVSLHRAEGFGRGIAEAMLLGRPVIVTGFSGNLDFTNQATAATVDFRLVPVAPGAYPFGEGQVWADADVDHAAWWMRRLATEPDLRRRLAANGRQMVAESYAPPVVGARYRAMLR